MRRFSYLAVAACAFSAAASTRSWTIQTVAGTDNAGDNGPATSASLAGVESIAIDASGNVWLADAAGGRIRKVTPQGVITTAAGTVGGSSADSGPAQQARLSNPYGVAAARDGTVYIAELDSGRVRRISPDGAISTLEAKFAAPRNLAVDPAGNLYVSDFGDHKVHRVARDGSVSVVAGSGTAGSGGDGGPAILASLRNPCGLAFDNSGALYIADSGNHRIRRVWQGFIATVTGGPGVLASPTGVAVDPAGALYIAESGNSRVLKFNGALSVLAPGIPARDVAIDAWNNLYIAAGERAFRLTASGRFELLAGDGGFAFRGDGGPAAEARLASPYGIAVGGNGAVYFSDQTNHRVRSVGRSGTIATVAGPAGLGATAGVALTVSGDLLVADFTNHRVLRVAPGGASTVVAGTGRPGSQGDGGPAARGELNQPVGVSIDPAGTIYIADSGNHRIRAITRDGYLITVAGTGEAGYAGDGGAALTARFNSPKGIAADGAGNVYVADTGNHAVRRISPLGIVTTMAGTGAAGPAPGQLDGPAGVAADTDGNLYIADTGNHRVIFAGKDGTVEVAAGTGAAGFSGDSGPADQAGLNTPSGIAIDREGGVWIADHLNRRVRKLTPVMSAPPAVTDPPPSTGPLTVLNGASLREGPVAAGQIVAVTGKGFRAGETQLVFDHYAARLFSVSETEIKGLVPREIAGRSNTSVRVVIAGVEAGSATVAVAPASAGVFTLDGGNGQAAAMNEDGSPNSARNPAIRGGLVTFYATGSGLDFLPVSVTIAGYAAEVAWSGPAPGSEGLLQVNARIPAGYAPAGAQALVLKVGASESQPGVTIAVK